MIRTAALALGILCLASPAGAHEFRPAHLELTTVGASKPGAAAQVGAPAPGDTVHLVLRRPKARGRIQGIDVVVEGCASTGAPTRSDAQTHQAERRRLSCPGGLAGRTVRATGLAATGVDLMVRVDGEPALVLDPDRPFAVLPAEPRGASAWLLLGIEHILLGPDHLLFVLGLMLLVGRRPRLLVGTVTSFTIAHSITLAAAILGWVNAPVRSVEAIIALSVLLLAWELSRTTDESGLARRQPWVFAFACGLLHGFGFAGALGELGLPEGAVASALFQFNVGVEVGQLAFVAVAALVARAVGSMDRWRPFLVYGMGGIAAFWFMDRAAPLVLG